MEAYIRGFDISAKLTPEEIDALRVREVRGCLEGPAINGGRGQITLQVGNGHTLDHGIYVSGQETMCSPNGAEIYVNIAPRFYGPLVDEGYLRLFIRKFGSLILSDSSRYTL